MVKLIESSQFADVPDIGVKFAEFSSPAMSKEAENIFGRSYASLKPTDDRYVGLHVVALGDEETFGQNRNNDAFPRNSCKLYHNTFVKHGHVFSHHHNDAKKDEILGVIKESAYNEKMGRIELFIWADKEKAKEGLDTLEKTGETAFSMACRIPWDECFPKGTLVQTVDGYRAIDTLERGDIVLSADGEACSVEATSVRMASKITAVKVGGLPLAIRSTVNHPYRVIRANAMRSCFGSVCGEKRRHKLDGTSTCLHCHNTVDLTETWVAAGELQRHDYLAVAVPECSTVDTVGPQFAYIVGQYAGDGSAISERRGRKGDGDINLSGLSFSLSKSERDADIIERLDRATMTVCGTVVNKLADGDKGAWVANLYDQSVAARVIDLIGAGSRTKRISYAIRGWSRREKAAFLAGLIDSDGCITPEKRTTRICTSSRSMALGIQQLCWSIGIPATCYVTTYGQENEHSIRGVYFSSGVAYGVQFTTYIPELFEFSAKLSRHLELADSKCVGNRIMLACGRAYLPVDSVDTRDSDPIAVYNIEVAGAHTYNAEGAAVHNCSICGAHRKNNSDPNMCDHIKYQLGKVAENGKVAYMRNVLPDFFDISFVTRPADRIAYSLKVAGSDDQIVTSEELAKQAEIIVPPWMEPGLVADKREVLRKLAEQYEEYARESKAREIFEPVAKTAEYSFDALTIETLRKMPVKEAMAFLTDRGAFMGPEAFCKYAMGPNSSEYAEVAPHAKAVASLAVQAIKEAAWLDKFDLTAQGDFDCDRFTARPSRRFQEVAYADEAVKQASLTDQDNVFRLVSEQKPVEKSASAHIDGSHEICFNTVDKPILAVALKYAEYKVAALNAVLNGAADGGTSNTKNRDALLALVAAQDL